MKIGFIKSVGDDRCPISQKNIDKWKKQNIDVLMEDGIGSGIGLTQIEEECSRETVLSEADIIYANNFNDLSELKSLNGSKIVVSFFEPYNGKFNPEGLPANVKIFSMDMIPRTTLAQSMDVLSSMASLAGYQAVITAAVQSERYFPMMMTAAGTIKPAQTLVIGAGVAGLQAIATAKRLGSRVEAFDVRAAVKQEVESLGAKFVEVEGSKDDSAAGGYAVQQSEDYLMRQKQEIAKSAAKSDVIICTAQLRGKKAPILITKEMVEAMKFGSIIVDMASSTGGNCELSKDNEEVFHHGVKIIGNSSLFLEKIIDASELLSNNVYNYLSTMFYNGELVIPENDEILKASMIYPKY